MIANVPKKRVDGGSSFASLFNYMRYEVNDDTGEILDRGVPWVSDSCFPGGSIVVKEMMIVAAMNHLVKDPIYHYVLSWPPSEQPTREQWRESVKMTLNSLGLKGHQACAVPHDDTAAFHVHVMVNRVHPDTYLAHAPEWSHYSLDEACRTLEKRFGWAEARGLYRWDEALNKPVKTEKSLLAKWRSERESDGISATGKPAKMEHYSDRESLESYCKGEPAKALRALVRQPGAASWEAIHGVLTRHSLQLHAGEKGGFTVSNEDQTIHVKASKVFRDLFSGKEMQAWRDANLGKYLPATPTAERPAPESRYRTDRIAKRDPVTRELRKQERKAEREKLLSQYKEAKEAFETKELPELQRKKIVIERHLKAVLEDYRVDRAKVKMSGLDATLKQLSYGMLRADSLKLQGVLKARLGAAKKAARFIKRDEWIAERAEQGDNAAIAYMRGLHYAEQRKKKLEQKASEEENCIGPVASGDHLPQVLSHPTLAWRFDRTNASVVYQLDGRMVFTDRGPRIEFTPDGMTDEGITAALQIARSKYGKTLSVTGSPAFRLRVAQLAYEHRHQLRIEFTDTVMQEYMLQGPRPAVTPPAQRVEVTPISNTVIDAKAPNEQTGRYSGVVLAVDATSVYQDVGRGAVVKHRLADFGSRPQLGDRVRIQYKEGAVKMETMVRSSGKGKENGNKGR